MEQDAEQDREVPRGFGTDSIRNLIKEEWT